MPDRIDQTGRQITVPASPQRIISLVPSQTELLYDLGLEEEVIGITKFCVRPEKWFRKKNRVGGTKQIKIDLIHQLQPDLIIANKEENVKEQVEDLARHYPVWISDVNNLDEAFAMIGSIGSLVNKEPAAKLMVSRIRENLSHLQPPASSSSACYLIWQKPYMTVGGDTFIHAMLEATGFTNAFGDRMRYPEVTIDDIRASRCELLLLSSEPFPFQQKHVEELQQLLPDTKVLLADGELFSWYGSRMLHIPFLIQPLYEQC